MSKNKKFLPILLFLTLLPILIFLRLSTFLVGPVSSVFATIDKVVISAPSTTKVGQAIRVQATVYTKRNR